MAGEQGKGLIVTDRRGHCSRPSLESESRFLVGLGRLHLCSSVTAPWEELAAAKTWWGADWECSQEAGLLNMMDCFHCAANPPACRQMA